jgi:hypothetical protein
LQQFLCLLSRFVISAFSLALTHFFVKPYLNSDGANFGPQYHTDIHQLRSRRAITERRAAAKAAAEDAKRSADRLRRQHEDRARQQREESVREQAMLEFLRSLRSFIRRDDCRVGDDDRDRLELAHLLGVE